MIRIIAAAALVGLLGDTKIGEVVADITLKTVDGKEIKLSDLRGEKGKVTVIYFQSDKCPSALKPDAVKAVADKWGGEDSKVQFIAVFGYSKDSEAVVKSYCESNKLGYPCVLDDGGKIASHLGAKKVNTTYVLDKDGKLVYRGGFTSKKKELAVEAVNAALAGKKAPESDGKFQG